MTTSALFIIFSYDPLDFTGIIITHIVCIHNTTAVACLTTAVPGNLVEFVATGGNEFLVTKTEKQAIAIQILL